MSQPYERLTAQRDLLIAVGSNMPTGAGDVKTTVLAAFAALDEAFGGGVQKSALYRTPCFPAGAGPDFVNAACRVNSDLPAAEVLATLHQTEADFGRERVKRWGQRTLDLDLIGAGAEIWPDPEVQKAWRDLPLGDQVTTAPEQLILPHPRLQDRAFVLVPLADVAAEWRHPALGLTVAEMLANLPEDARAEVVRI